MGLIFSSCMRSPSWWTEPWLFGLSSARRRIFHLNLRGSRQAAQECTLPRVDRLLNSKGCIHFQWPLHIRKAWMWNQAVFFLASHGQTWSTCGQCPQPKLWYDPWKDPSSSCLFAGIFCNTSWNPSYSSAYPAPLPKRKSAFSSFRWALSWLSQYCFHTVSSKAGRPPFG